MENELKYNIIRRDVKNVRLRVSEDGTVDIYAPEHFSDSDINSIIEKKSRWIDSKYDYFKKKKTILLNRNEILLFGNRYTYYYSTRYENKVEINNESKTIQAKRDLLDIDINRIFHALKELSDLNSEQRKIILEFLKIIVKVSDVRNANITF